MDNKKALLETRGLISIFFEKISTPSASCETTHTHHTDGANNILG